MKDLGDTSQLSIDCLFKGCGNHFNYQWSVEGEKINEDDEGFKNSDTDTLTIDCFESKYAGTYQCVISTSSQPIISMSAEVELDIRGKFINATIIMLQNIHVINLYAQNLKILIRK